MASRQEQIDADAALARRLQEEEMRNVFMPFAGRRSPAPYSFAPSSSSAPRSSPSTSRGAEGVPDRQRAPYSFVNDSNSSGADAASHGGGSHDPTPGPPPHRDFSHFHPHVGPAGFFDAFEAIFRGMPGGSPRPLNRTARHNAFGPLAEFTTMIDEMNFMREHPSRGGGGATFFMGGPIDGDVHRIFQTLFEAGGMATYEDLLDLIERRGNVNRGARDDELGQIPTEQYVPKPRGASSSAAAAAAGANEGEKCVICLAEFERDEPVKRLPCGHIFHGECVDRWLKVNRTCPSCKRSIRRDEQNSNQRS